MFAVTYGLLIGIPVLYKFVVFSAAEGSRSANNVHKMDMGESGHNLLAESDREFFYVRHSHGIKQINRMGQFVRYCDLNKQEEAVIRGGRIFGCSLERYPENVCSLLNCSHTADVSSTTEPFQYRRQAFRVTESADRSQFTIISFSCSFEKPMAVTVEVQSASNVAALYCPCTHEEDVWDPFRHRLLHSFQYDDDRYIISGDDKPGEAASAQLVVLNGDKKLYTWKVQSVLSCLASYRSVVHSYTCATAALMVKKEHGLSPEDTLYVAFYYNDKNFSCRSAQTYDEYSDTIGEGTTVLCAFPMSHAERDVRGKGQETLNLDRTHTLKLELMEIDEQPMLLLAERAGFYIYSIVDTVRISLRSEPAFGGSWSTIGMSGRNFLVTSKKEIVAVINSSVLRFDVDMCSKKTNCDDCLSSNQKYCGWCVLEKRCSTMHGCPSAMKYSDTLYGLWLYARQNNYCPRLTPSIARTTLSRKALILPIADGKFGFPFSGSHFPMKGAYVDDFSCRITVLNTNGSVPPVHSMIERLRYPHDELHAEFLCRYPSTILTVLNNTASYEDNRLNIGITLTYIPKSRSVVKPVDLKTVSIRIVLCEELNCVQCIKEHEACIWSATDGLCMSFVRTSPEEATNAAHSAVPAHVCNSSDVFIPPPRTIHIRSNKPTILPRNFSHESIVFFGENLDLLNTTILDTSVGSCTVNVTNYNRDNVTCIMSGKFVRENITVRFYTDNGTIICSGCQFRLFDVITSTTLASTKARTTSIEARGAISALNTEHFRMEINVGTTTPVPGLLASPSVVQYLLIFIGTATVVFLILLIFLIRLHCLTKKGDRKMKELRERARLLIPQGQLQGPILPPGQPELGSGMTRSHILNAQSEDSGIQDRTSSMESIQTEGSSEPPESIYETSG